MALLYLVRHGQTEWNKAKIFRGRRDIPLNDTGRREAQCCALALRQMPLIRLYSSPLSRATETAEIIASNRDLTVLPDPAFLDIDYGEWTGKADAEVGELFPDAYRLWKKSPHRMRFPSGETLNDVRRRATTRLFQLGQLHATKAVGIVSHRVVLKLLLAEAQRLDNSRFWTIPFDTAAISILNVSENTMQVVLNNDTQHLQSMPDHDNVDF